VKANDRWRELNRGKLASAVYTFLFMLLSTDKQGEETFPADPKRRKTCNAGWKCFFITDEELRSLALEVATGYLEDAAHLG